jgi:hypothetical protein
MRAAAGYLNSCKYKRPNPLPISSSRGTYLYFSPTNCPSIILDNNAHHPPKAVGKDRANSSIALSSGTSRRSQRKQRTGFANSQTTAPRRHQMEYSDDEIQGSDSTLIWCSHQGFGGWFKQFITCLDPNNHSLCSSRAQPDLPRIEDRRSI